MTLPEAARFLRLSRFTLYRYVETGRVPAAKVGKHWRFLREGLEAWLAERAGGPATAGSGVDLGLLAANLRLTPTGRVEKHRKALAGVLALRDAGRRHRRGA